MFEVEKQILKDELYDELLKALRNKEGDRKEYGGSNPSRTEGTNSVKHDGWTEYGIDVPAILRSVRKKCTDPAVGANTTSFPEDGRNVGDSESVRESKDEGGGELSVHNISTKEEEEEKEEVSAETKKQSGWDIKQVEEDGEASAGDEEGADEEEEGEGGDEEVADYEEKVDGVDEEAADEEEEAEGGGTHTPASNNDKVGEVISEVDEIYGGPQKKRKCNIAKPDVTQMPKKRVRKNPERFGFTPAKKTEMPREGKGIYLPLAIVVPEKRNKFLLKLRSGRAK